MGEDFREQGSAQFRAGRRRVPGQRARGALAQFVGEDAKQLDATVRAATRTTPTTWTVRPSGPSPSVTTSASSSRCLGASVPRCLGASVPRCLGAAACRCLGASCPSGPSSVPRCLGASVPLILPPHGPLILPVRAPAAERSDRLTRLPAYRSGSTVTAKACWPVRRRASMTRARRGPTSRPFPMTGLTPPAPRRPVTTMEDTGGAGRRSLRRMAGSGLGGRRADLDAGCHLLAVGRRCCPLPMAPTSGTRATCPTRRVSVSGRSVVKRSLLLSGTDFLPAP